MKLLSLCLLTAILSTSCAMMGKKCCKESCDKKVSCCKQDKGDCNQESCSKKNS